MALLAALARSPVLSGGPRRSLALPGAVRRSQALPRSSSRSPPPWRTSRRSPASRSKVGGSSQCPDPVRIQPHQTASSRIGICAFRLNMLTGVAMKAALHSKPQFLHEHFDVTCICATLSSTIAHESFLIKQNPTPAPPVVHIPTAAHPCWLPSLIAHPTAQVSQDHPTPCCQATAAHNKQSSSIRGILARPIHGFVATVFPACASATRRDKWRCELPAATCP